MFVLAGGAAVAWGPLDTNDPWPKYCRDQRNTCDTTHAGPHAKPDLRWWARLNQNPDDSLPNHLRGPVVARLGIANTRHILIGTRDVNESTVTGRLLVFRYHPDGNHWGTGELEAVPMATIYLDSPVNSTPLVLPNDWVVVQTETHIEVWNLQSPTSPPEEPVWRAALASTGGSPAYGPMYAGGGDGYLYVVGDGGILYCIDPYKPKGEIDLAALSEWWWPMCPGYDDEGKTSPAMGPISDDPEDPARNFVYVSTTYNRSGDNLFALYADGNYPDPKGWSAWPYEEHTQWGSYSSPSVHHGTVPGLPTLSNQVVIGCDNYTFYAYYNQCQRPDDDTAWPLRWGRGTGSYISATAGLTPDGHVIFWTESGDIFDFIDELTHETFYGTTHVEANWQMGAPVVDSAGRFYMNTAGNVTLGTQSALVLAYQWPIGDDPLLWTWGLEADLPVGVPRLQFGGPCAEDTDGTLYCASFGYLFALRPPLGDFAGDGGADISDLGAVRAALLDPLTWDEQYGAVRGINLLGVAAADNDDAFTLSDVAPLVDKMANGCNDWATDEDWTAFREAVEALYDDLGMEE